jgi:hypothetical protein
MKAGMIMFKKRKKHSIIFIIISIIILIASGCSRDITREELFYITGRVELPETADVMAVQSYTTSGPVGSERLAISSVEENIFTIPLETANIKPREYIVKLEQDIDGDYLQNEVLKGKRQST